MANNHIHDAFDEIRADEKLKESTKQFLSARRKHVPQPQPRYVSGRMLAALCAFFLLVTGIKGYSWLHTPVSYVSIDINPSIELALNRLDRVASVTAFNEDGETLVRGLSLKGKKYTDAIDTLMASSGMERYLLNNEELVFTVASDERNAELQSGIDHCQNHSEHRCLSVSADPALISGAHENGLSIGKYYAYLQLAAYDDTVTVEDCRDMSISEIHRCIRMHGQQEETGGHHDGHGHHGHE